MRLLFFFLLTAAAGLVQTAFLSDVRFFGAGPDIFLALTVIAAVSMDSPGALAAGAVNGLMKDIFDAGAFGFNTAVFPFLAFLIARLNRTFSLDNRPACSLVTAAAVIAAESASWLIRSYFHPPVPCGIFLRLVFLETVFTAAAVFPLSALARIPAGPRS